MGIKNRNDRIWLAVNTETGEADYLYVHEDCNSDCKWGERARATDCRLIDGWEFRPFMIVPDTDTLEPRAEVINLRAQNERLMAALSEALGHADYFSKMYDDCVAVMETHDEDRCDRLHELRKILHNDEDQPAP